MMFPSIALLSLAASALASAVPQGANTWKTLESIPIAPRQEHGVVALSDKEIAIIGGIVPNKDADGFQTTSLVQFYNTRSNSWRRYVTEAPVKVNHPNVAAVNGKIYLLGGLSEATDGAWRAFPESWVYNPDLDEWTELEPVPEDQERGSAAVGVYGNIIYMAGGMRTLEPIGPGGEQDTVAFVSAFDTKTSKWLDLPKAAQTIPEGRDHAAASVVGSKMYVLGGRLRGQRNVKDTVFILDLDDLEKGWTTSDAKMPTPRGGVVSGTVGKKIYVLGGEGNTAEDSDGIFNEIEVFDTAKESWESVGKMSLPRHGGQAVAVKGGIYLPGGGISEGGSPVETLDVYWP
ncbi:kelch domain-containing protein 8a [Fusarium flagelliforme]|uniref:Kelch domain-containing protein 8a n=1 Tax=Fusarium flagelliforme TaxID=2675880 RepID=A0A395M4E6_9HYPO|nr:kelch domain-containing protein 8a [Fusarium flagelliforme]